MEPGGRVTGAIADQLRLLRHRGPDAEGAFEGTDAAVGQSRLAVIDLVGANPPVTNADGTIGVALNGEIYNYRELRAELKAKGHRLRTEGDTEVIAHLAEDHGPADLARRLVGMFAFAVWDEGRRRLVLGRDRVGKKPLYYWSGTDRLVFGSEIKAVVAHPAVPRNLDPRAIPRYLALGYVPTPGTFFQGVRSVPPGHVLVAEPGRSPTVERYWAPSRPASDKGGRPPPFNDAARDVRRHLRTAVERRLIADVPLGAFLSGGLDSSSVVALMAEAIGRVATFTIGFDDDDGFDERPLARLVARRFGTEHTEFVVKPDATELVERLVWHYDQPFGDSSALPTFLLAELTRAEVTVALSGDGGDEVFGGYERFAAALAHRRIERVPGPLRRAVAAASGRLPVGTPRGRVAGARRFLTGVDKPLLDAYLSWVGCVPGHWRDRLLPAGTVDTAVEEYRQAWEASPAPTTLGRLMDLNVRSYLLDDLLPKVDRMSMAHALEVRSPFLDVDLMGFALRLPDHHLVRGRSLKRVLRAAMADVLPPEVLTAPKRGFGVPVDRWFREDLRGFVRAMLCDPQARVAAHLVPEALRDLVDEHVSGGANHGGKLWTLLTLEVFLRREGW